MNTPLKKLAVVACAVTLGLATQSCNNNNESTTTTTEDSTKMSSSVTEKVNEATTNVKEAAVHNPDSTFVAEVVVANNEEIRLLQEGADKGTSKELKSHAKMMIADHKGLKKKMEAYAASKNYPVMNNDEGDAAKKISDMSSKTGKDWDKEWVDAMVSGHEKTIGKFEGAQGQVNDQELKTMITNTLPTLRSHLEMVKGMQDKMK